MASESGDGRIFADDLGIHFRHAGIPDIVVHWGEIESVDAVRNVREDGSSFIEVYVNHFSGVDFRFHDVEEGYAQVMAAMEAHLSGFSRAQIEAAAGTWEEKLDVPVPWRRDESLQPFQLQPPDIDPREPTPAELAQMDAARQATIATCEKLLGRPLHAAELACIHVGFENGRIVGGIASPLADLLARGQPGQAPPSDGE